MDAAPTNAGRTARDRARAELTREIKDEARRQLAVDGADGLSLRAVARELGMVSSALYRYFPSRDDLLTALIIDAYESLAATVTSADPGPTTEPRERWRLTCSEVRNWALANRHEYALIYGSPIPGYQAPQATIAPASAVPLLLVGVLTDGWRAGALTPQEETGPLSTELAAQVEALGVLIAPELPPHVLARALLAWTQLFGVISFELFGQLVGSVDPSGYFFDYAVDQMADYVGLRVHNRGRAQNRAPEVAIIGKNTQNPGAS
ncbi:MAG TPA: TetR/AcrR family transcriptional regulator [Pseudonocardiaceae bacterium]|jgi:AcrR family transcriptional regulator|nr:TetR/AcrR family transcriptional regulator [Pseudonocardiaceae bacterium]